MLASVSFVGRGAELAVLSRSLEEVRGLSESRVVTLLGTRGIGKSRLVREFLSRSDWSRAIICDASPDHAAGGLMVQWLRSRFELTEDMDVDTARTQLRSHVARVLDDRRVGDVCFVLGKLLNLEFMDSPITRAISQHPEEEAHVRRAVMRSFLEADAAREPLVLVLENLEGADTESLDWLQYLINTIRGPVLFLCVGRLELLARRRSWFEVGGGRHNRLDLDVLSEGESRTLLTQVLAPCEAGVPEELLDFAVQRVGGIPGLAEEQVRALQSAEVLVRPSASADTLRWRVDLQKLNATDVLERNEDVAAALVLKLSPVERRVLEHAAAMGSVFWFGGLLALARMDVPAPGLWEVDSGDEHALRATLAQLVRKDHVLEMPDSTFPGDNEYVFKHRREREAAAAMSSPTLTKHYHHTIAEWLAQKDEVRSQEEHCAMVAEHLEKAGCQHHSAMGYLEAADIARSRFRAAVADDYYRRGLQFLGDVDAKRRADALHHHGDVMRILGKREEALAAYREMLSIAFRYGLHTKGGAAHGCLGRVYRDMGSMPEARQHFDAALELYRAASDLPGVATCHDDIGTLFWAKGETETALEQLRTGLELRRALGDRHRVAVSLSNIGRVLLDAQDLAAARESIENALGIRREIGDPLGVVESLVDLGRLTHEQGDERRALSLFREAYAAATEIGERNRISMVMTCIGQTYDRLGDYDQAVKVLLESREICEELGDKLHLGEAERSLSEVYLKQGELRKARDSIKRAVDLFGQLKSKPQLALAVRVLGQITASGAWGKDHRAKAADYFMRSIALYKEMGNDLETARSYKAFVGYVRSSEDHKDKPDVIAQAERLDHMADEILSRRRPVGNKRS